MHVEQEWRQLEVQAKTVLNQGTTGGETGQAHRRAGNSTERKRKSAMMAMFQKQHEERLPAMNALRD